MFALIGSLVIAYAVGALVFVVYQLVTNKIMPNE